MKEACDIMQLPWIFRKAVLVLNTLQVLTSLLLLQSLQSHQHASWRESWPCLCTADQHRQASADFGQTRCFDVRAAADWHPGLALATYGLDWCQVEETDAHFRTAVKAGGILDIVEQYPFDGSLVKHARRDKRQGQHIGSVKRTEEGLTLV